MKRWTLFGLALLVLMLMWFTPAAAQNLKSESGTGDGGTATSVVVQTDDAASILAARVQSGFLVFKEIPDGVLQVYRLRCMGVAVKIGMKPERGLLAGVGTFKGNPYTIFASCYHTSPYNDVDAQGLCGTLSLPLAKNEPGKRLVTCGKLEPENSAANDRGGGRFLA